MMVKLSLQVPCMPKLRKLVSMGIKRIKGSSTAPLNSVRNTTSHQRNSTKPIPGLLKKTSTHRQIKIFLSQNP